MGLRLGTMERYVMSSNRVEVCVIFHSDVAPTHIDAARFIRGDTSWFYTVSFALNIIQIVSYIPVRPREIRSQKFRDLAKLFVPGSFYSLSTCRDEDFYTDVYLQKVHQYCVSLVFATNAISTDINYYVLI